MSSLAVAHSTSTSLDMAMYFVVTDRGATATSPFRANVRTWARLNARRDFVLFRECDDLPDAWRPVGTKRPHRVSARTGRQARRMAQYLARYSA